MPEGDLSRNLHITEARYLPPLWFQDHLFYPVQAPFGYVAFEWSSLCATEEGCAEEEKVLNLGSSRRHLQTISTKAAHGFKTIICEIRLDFLSVKEAK